MQTTPHRHIAPGTAPPAQVDRVFEAPARTLAIIVGSNWPASPSPSDDAESTTWSHDPTINLNRRHCTYAYSTGICLMLVLGCAGGGTAPDPPVQQTFSHHRQCGRDAGNPEMTLVVIDDDGTTAEVWGLLDVDVRWGRTSTVRLQSRYNSATRYTSTQMVTLLEEVPAPGVGFRMNTCAGSFLQPDGRAFIDGKRFECGDPDVCAELDRRRQADPKARFDLVLRHASNVDDPLILEAVTDPTCKDTLDCGAQDECCRSDDTSVCVPWGTCGGTVVPYGEAVVQ